MNCDKCGKQAVALYSIPRPIGHFLNDPRAPKWCYDCWVQDYGSKDELDAWWEQHPVREQRTEVVTDPQIDRAIDADMEHQRHGL